MKSKSGIILGIILSTIIHGGIFYILDVSSSLNKNINLIREPIPKVVNVQIVTLSENPVKSVSNLKKNTDNSITRRKSPILKRETKNLNLEDTNTDINNRKKHSKLVEAKGNNLSTSKRPVYDIRRKLEQEEKRFTSNFNYHSGRDNLDYKFKTKDNKNNRGDSDSSNNIIPIIPPDFKFNSKPVYPIIAREKGYEGTVVLLIEIDHQGKVINRSIAKSSGHPILDKSALKASERWRFDPAKIKNVGIRSKILVPVEFKLEK